MFISTNSFLWCDISTSVTNTEITDQLLPKARMLCQRAVRILAHFCWNIVQSNITLAELKEVTRLEVSVEESMREFYRIDFREGRFPEWEKLRSSLQSRVKEYQKYEERKKQLFRLAAYCHELAPG